jgi:hypothetical protein
MTAAYTTSPEGGTSKAAPVSRSKQQAVAVAVAASGLAGSSGPGRGYEPRSSRLRTSSVGRLAWTKRSAGEAVAVQEEGGPPGQQGSAAPPGDAIRGGSSSRLVVTPGPNVPDRSSRPYASTGWTPVRVVTANWGTFGRHRALQDRCPLFARTNRAQRTAARRFFCGCPAHVRRVRTFARHGSAALRAPDGAPMTLSGRRFDPFPCAGSAFSYRWHIACGPRTPSPRIRIHPRSAREDRDVETPVFTHVGCRADRWLQQRADCSS